MLKKQTQPCPEDILLEQTIIITGVAIVASVLIRVKCCTLQSEGLVEGIDQNGVVPFPVISKVIMDAIKNTA
jgi:hypothetical protein